MLEPSGKWLEVCITQRLGGAVQGPLGSGRSRGEPPAEKAPLLAPLGRLLVDQYRGLTGEGQSLKATHKVASHRRASGTGRPP